jgi:hypothetical protein
MNPSKTKARGGGAFGAVLLAMAAVAALPAYVRIRRVVEATAILNSVDTASVFGTKRKED